MKFSEAQKQPPTPPTRNEKFVYQKRTRHNTNKIEKKCMKRSLGNNLKIFFNVKFIIKKDEIKRKNRSISNI
jgi:hypothetical protein